LALSGVWVAMPLWTGPTGNRLTCPGSCAELLRREKMAKSTPPKMKGFKTPKYTELRRRRNEASVEKR